MPRPPLSFRLKPSDAAALEALLQGGVQPVRVVRRALALLALNRGESAPTVSALVRFSPQAVRNIAQRYRAGGLDGALYERPRPGAAEVLAPAEKQRIIAMVCADPPAGAARWTVRLITEQAVKRKVVGQVGRETIRVLLQSHDLNVSRREAGVPARRHPLLFGAVMHAPRPVPRERGAPSPEPLVLPPHHDYVALHPPRRAPEVRL